MEKANMDDELTNDVKEVLKRLKELENHPKWQANGDKPCKMFKMEIDGRVASKGIAIVNFSIGEIFAFLDKEDTLKLLNSQLIQIKVLHEKKDVFRVNYMQYSGIWPVSNRDFVSVSAKFPEGDKIYIGTRACNYPFAEVKGVVRGRVFIGGYIIQKIDETSCKVTYISDADLAGSIPGMVKNTLSVKQGEIASRIEKALQKAKEGK